MICLSTDLVNHRLGAFIYGFLCGVGLILIIWGVASIAMLPSGTLLTSISLTLFGVALFAVGSVREAYLREMLSMESKVHMQKRSLSEPTNLISEQIIEDPEEVELQKTNAS